MGPEQFCPNCPDRAARLVFTLPPAVRVLACRRCGLQFAADYPEYDAADAGIGVFYQDLSLIPQMTVAENAAEIRGLAVQLYERLSTFGSHLSGLGKDLGNSVKSFNKAVGSLERMVFPAARRFTELGVNPKQPLETLNEVEETPREITDASSGAEVEPGPDVEATRRLGERR